MRMPKLPLAACLLFASGTAGPAVEMTKPFEALEQSRRFMIELDRRQRREKGDRLKQERADEAKRKGEEAARRKQEQAEKARQATERKRVQAAEKARQDSERQQVQAVEKETQAARPSPMSVPPAGSAADKPDRVPSPASPSPTKVQAGTAPPTAQPLTPPAANPPARPELVKPTVGAMSNAQEGAKDPVKGASLDAKSPSDHAIAPATAAPSIAASRLTRMNLYDERGDRLGDVERVLQGADGKFHIVIGFGLRIRDRDVRIPLRQVTMRKDRLVAQRLTGEQVKTMPIFDGKDRTYREVARDVQVPLARDVPSDL